MYVVSKAAKVVKNSVDLGPRKKEARSLAGNGRAGQ